MSQINGNLVNSFLNSNAYITQNNEFLEDNWNSMYNWGLYNGDVISQTLFPGMQQFAEWSQQMVSQMYQNQWNSAPEQMRRALEAGINPYLAANGIAGNGSSSAQSAPPSAVGAGASSLQSIGSTLGTVASLASSGIQGYAMLKKLRPEIDKIDAETENLFVSMGFTKLQSKAMTIQLDYMGKREQIGVWQALADLDKTRSEYANLVQTHNNLIAQYDEILAHKDLLVAQKGEVEARKILDDAMARKENAIAKFQEDENNFFANRGFLRGNSIYEGIRNSIVEGKSFDVDGFGSAVSEYEGKVQNAIESAKASASWDYRPSNVVEAASIASKYFGQTLRDIILDSNGVRSWADLKTKIFANHTAKREFNESYNNAKEDLYEEYLSKKRYYRNIRRGGNTAEVARAKNAMENARSEYESLTIDKFGLQILSQITNNVTSSQNK